MDPLALAMKITRGQAVLRKDEHGQLGFFTRILNQEYLGETTRGYEDRMREAAAATDRFVSAEEGKRGDYAKGKFNWFALPITIETPAGAFRRGPGWAAEVQAHYGEIDGTTGADGDPIDVFLNPRIETTTCLIIDQVDPRTKKFDEHKVMLGWEDSGKALDVYAAAFSDGLGYERIGGSKEMALSDFTQWLKGDTTKPASALKKWDESEHPRNSDGEFSRKSNYQGRAAHGRINSKMAVAAGLRAGDVRGVSGYVASSPKPVAVVGFGGERKQKGAAGIAASRLEGSVGSGGVVLDERRMRVERVYRFGHLDPKSLAWSPFGRRQVIDRRAQSLVSIPNTFGEAPSPVHGKSVVAHELAHTIDRARGAGKRMASSSQAGSTAYLKDLLRIRKTLRSRAKMPSQREVYWALNPAEAFAEATTALRGAKATGGVKQLVALRAMMPNMIRLAGKILGKADWNEAQHPRDEDGQFTHAAAGRNNFKDAAVAAGIVTGAGAAAGIGYMLSSVGRRKILSQAIPHILDLFRNPIRVGNKPTYPEIKRSMQRASHLFSRERLLVLDRKGKVLDTHIGGEHSTGFSPAFTDRIRAAGKFPEIGAVIHNHPPASTAEAKLVTQQYKNVRRAISDNLFPENNATMTAYKRTLRRGTILNEPSSLDHQTHHAIAFQNRSTHNAPYPRSLVYASTRRGEDFIHRLDNVPGLEDVRTLRAGAFRKLDAALALAWRNV